MKGAELREGATSLHTHSGLEFMAPGWGRLETRGRGGGKGERLGRWLMMESRRGGRENEEWRDGEEEPNYGCRLCAA